MGKRITKLSALVIVVIFVAMFSFSTLTASAAQVGNISIQEKEILAEITLSLMSNKKIIDLNEVTYQIAASKIMRDRIKDTEFDLPDHYEEELYQDCLNKASDGDPELATYLEKWNLTHEDIADTLFYVRLNGEIKYRYASLVAPKITSENPGLTDATLLLDKFNEHVKELVSHMPTAHYDRQSVIRISEYAAQQGIEIEK